MTVYAHVDSPLGTLRLTGYAGGLERKQQLPALEGVLLGA
ncbi:MGMT family protein [Nocardia goodfellowii]|uniref:O6-methylguanine-DNA--protein-cysteine methyltransferase n=1 Tax=Nocardia goodfellowii TaxID=882446 RepID=A0ABS4QRS5_9NOCA|nr:MGMT family protein [Nocardia goodfellowii]MBP2194421.1 O6-methylguanine-DNA--protein-cysteine methyltransferase [Nocardia goodfellowii]